MGRELRKVPANWEHPKNENGHYRPLYNENYRAAMNRWISEYQMWCRGEHPDQLSVESAKEYEEYADWTSNPPNIEYYLPYYPDDRLLCTHYQGYETCSEGTPITPVFATIDECAEYAAEHATTFADFKAPKEKWLAIFGGDIEMHREGNVIFL